MNCKPGDLAVFVKSRAGNEGKIVRCLRLATSAEIKAVQFSNDLGPVWLTDSTFRAIRRMSRTEEITSYAHDQNLRPIRPQADDATDEVIQRIGKPEGVPA